MRDEEHEALYRKIHPELDLILWVIKADDRVFSINERFYQQVMADHQHRVLFVINQADKIEPCHGWNATNNTPSPNQLANIDAKKNRFATYSHPLSNFTEAEMASRAPVWYALSELFTGRELQGYDYRWMIGLFGTLKMLLRQVASI